MSRRPETLQDWILLMQATKEKYGNLQVKLIYSDNSLENDEFSDLSDVLVQGAVSLIKDDERFDEDSKRFVIVLD